MAQCGWRWTRLQLWAIGRRGERAGRFAFLAASSSSVVPGGERVATPGKRERVLLAYLALSPNYRQPRRKLTTLLWGDAADETTLDNLRNCLWNLRKALGDTEHRVVASEGEDIVLDVAAFDVDALAFRRLAAQSGRTGAGRSGGALLRRIPGWARYRERRVRILAPRGSVPLPGSGDRCSHPADDATLRVRRDRARDRDGPDGSCGSSRCMRRQCAA